MSAPSTAHDHLRYVQNNTVALVGCPSTAGQGKGGVEHGPDALVRAGLPAQLRGLGWDVEFTGQQDFAALATPAAVAQDADMGKMKKPRTVSAITRHVAAVVAAHAQQGKVPVTLGGDHSLGLGTVLGTLSSHPDLGLIWVDAHADINTPLTTESGNLHGCPVSFLLGMQDSRIPPFDWLPGPAKKFLDPKRLVYIGLRDVDPPERKILKDLGIKAYSMFEVDKYGIGTVVDMALDYLNDGQKGKRERPIHLSFDVDAMDPTVAASTGTPVRGGLTFREGHYVCEAVYETGALVGMDIMEVNPALNPEHAQATTAIGCSLVRAALGETLLGL